MQMRKKKHTQNHSPQFLYGELERVSLWSLQHHTVVGDIVGVRDQ